MARKVRNDVVPRDVQLTGQTIAPVPDFKIYRTAIYVRLSLEDSGKNDPAIIENQISYLQEYAKDKADLNVTGTFIDNGWTGTNFERPGFTDMMEAVKEQKIDCILIKDLSRLGRNFIETGNYIEKIFPLLGVRLIAVNEGFDTHSPNHSAGLVIPFKNLINEVYAKDISRKVSSAFEIKMQEGKLGGGVVPYGYQKKDKHLNIDPETAEIVKQIFVMRADGKSYHAIARSLNEAGILSPSAYRYEKGLVYHERFQGVLWKRHVLKDMLSNRVYLGELIRGKTKTAIYKGEKLHKVPEDQQKVTHNAHEAIIDEVLFDKVRNISETKKMEHLNRLGKNDCFGKEENIFGKRIICADCGAILTMHRSIVRQKNVYYYFVCPTFVENRELVCSRKSMRKEQLEEAVLEVIRLHISRFVDEKNLIRKLNRGKQVKPEKKNVEMRLRELGQQLKKKEALDGALYIDYKDGLLNRKEYLYAKDKFTNEIILLRNEIQTTEKKLTEFDEQYGDDFEISKIIEHHIHPEKLNKEMVDCFIQRIAVYSEGRIEVTLRYQDVLIHLDELTHTGKISISKETLIKSVFP